MAKTRVNVIIVISILSLWLFKTIPAKLLEGPKFTQPIANNTVAVGREAILSCTVENLASYKVAWLRVDTQTILTIHNHVITKNNRIGVSHSELKTWYLHIKEVKELDKGWYMCQINTDPMKSQVGYLDIVVSPDILDLRSSSDVVVDEGSNVTLQCVARGSPKPSITWKRENGELIPISNFTTFNGSILHITKIKRGYMGPYLCIASNGVPPSISKRIMVTVQFPPSIWIQYQLIGAYDGQQITLECHSEAYPKSINYWTRDNGEIIPHSNKYLPEIIENGYKVHLKLTLSLLNLQDYGIYRCISKNSLGDIEGTINIYRISNPHLKKNTTSIKMKNLPHETNSIPNEKDKTNLRLFENVYQNSGNHQVQHLLCIQYSLFINLIIISSKL